MCIRDRVRLMIDLPNDAPVIAMFPWREGARYLVASKAGDGFVVPAGDILAQTRAGKQVLNGEAVLCRPVSGDHVAVVGENRKLLVFALSELPEMGRGKGVRLQKYKDGGLSDAICITLADGLRWQESGGRTRTEPDLKKMRQALVGMEYALINDKLGDEEDYQFLSLIHI